MLEIIKFTHSIDKEDLFDSIASQLQNNDDLDLSYEEILDKLCSADLGGYLEVCLTVSVNLDTKEIEDIY